MNALVTIQFRIDNVCNLADIKHQRFSEIVKEILVDEGICGVIDIDNYKILSIEAEKNL